MQTMHFDPFFRRGGFQKFWSLGLSQAMLGRATRGLGGAGPAQSKGGSWAGPCQPVDQVNGPGSIFLGRFRAGLGPHPPIFTCLWGSLDGRCQSKRYVGGAQCMQLYSTNFSDMELRSVIQFC